MQRVDWEVVKSKSRNPPLFAAARVYSTVEDKPLRRTGRNAAKQQYSGGKGRFRRYSQAIVSVSVLRDSFDFRK